MRNLWRKLARHAVAMAVTLLVGTFAAATMVRLAPGFDVDAQQLDSRLSHDSIEALHASRAANRDIGRFYLHYVAAAARGEFGTSLIFNRPVRELVAQRWGVTAKLAGVGLLAGWIMAAALALAVRLLGVSSVDLFATSMAGLALCLPSAVLALLFVIWQLPPALAISMVVFPKAFRYANDLLAHNYALSHVITARAKGLGPVRVFLRHVLPISAAPLLALMGVSVTMALGAAVPVEALCSIPGIAQLAWQAALGRDLPTLVTVTMLVALVTLAANAIADLLQHSYTRTG